LGTRPRAHCSLSLGKTRRVHLVSAHRLGRKRGRGGETGEQLVEEIVSELTNDLVENVRMPNVGGDRAFAGEVSGSSAPETGAWERACLGLVNVHWDSCWKDRCRKWGECDRSTCGNWSRSRGWKYARCVRPWESSRKLRQRVSGSGAAKHLVLPEGT
jgi:hypothetical protein